MARPASRYPTELELQILKIVWRTGPGTVRQVRDALAEFRPLAYTTVMTIMNMMTKKGYLGRIKHGPSFIYRPLITERATTRKMLADLKDRAFDGSAATVMLNLLETGELDAAELKELRQLIDRKVDEAKE